QSNYELIFISLFVLIFVHLLSIYSLIYILILYSLQPSIIFFFNDTSTTEIYTLSLHDALPIFARTRAPPAGTVFHPVPAVVFRRSEEHTSELQSPCNLVCRLLLEKKKYNIKNVSQVYKLILDKHAHYSRIVFSYTLGK